MSDHAGPRSLGRDGAPIESAGRVPEHHFALPPQIGAPGEAELSSLQADAAIDEIFDHPLDTVAAVPVRVLRGLGLYWSPLQDTQEVFEGRNHSWEVAGRWFNIVLILPFALLTLVAAVFRRSRVGATAARPGRGAALGAVARADGRVGVDDRGELRQRAVPSRDRAVARGVRRARDHDRGDRAHSARPHRAGFVAAERTGHHLELDGDVDRDRARAVGDRGAMEREPPPVVGLDLAEPAVLVELDDAACRPSAQCTILAIGSSMIPAAPASLRSGINVLISLFDTTVSTA